MQHRSCFLFPSRSLKGSRTLLHRLVPIFSACPTDAVSCSGSSVFVRCDGKRILGAGREWCMHRLSSVDIEHRFRVNSYWLRSIYRSVNFSQVMDSLGAQLTCLTKPIPAFLLNTGNRTVHGGRCEIQRSLGYNSHSFKFLVCYRTQSWCDFWLASNDLFENFAAGWYFPLSPIFRR